MLVTPSLSANDMIINSIGKEGNDRYPVEEYIDDVIHFPALRYDTNFYPIETTQFNGQQNDIGYNTDAGNELRRAFPIFIGEPIDQRIPGQGRIGSLNPDDRDDEDWYTFTVANGQQITTTITPGFTIDIIDANGVNVGFSYTAETTARHFVKITTDAGAGEYTFDILLTNQNDAGTGGDAGNSITTATPITPGEYSGYLSYTDVEDWYSFHVASGSGIKINLEPLDRSDFDIHLYNPNNELVHSAQYYGDDTLEYPADMTGIWKIKLDIFPGWDESKWPEDYLLYGSGAYTLSLELGGSFAAPATPIAQPTISPVAQTFILQDDPDSNKDEYSYLAAVPAANYLSNGKRYLSPIAYQGVDYIPTWFTTVDQTTQYLLDDWNTYLARHDMTAEEYLIPNTPVVAAADIAVNKWDSSDMVVLATDGSVFEDEIVTVVDSQRSFSSMPSINHINPSDLKDIGGTYAKPTFIGKKWGAIHLRSVGDDFKGDTGLITPRYEGVMEDWWPHPYDSNGEDSDTFYPVSLPGLWFPYVTDTSGLDELQVILFEGDRFTIPVVDSQTSIQVRISTQDPSYLIAYLIDPEGNVRRPHMPHFNGGEIKPLHQWNGGHWEHDQEEFRRWIMEPHTEFTVDVHNAMKGKWTVIVVPYVDENGNDVGFSGSYHVTIEKRVYNQKRIDAIMSASNAAVIASLNHAPLLYVTETEVPSETVNAISKLGANKILYVNINGVSSAAPSATETFTTVQSVYDEIKSYDASENFITLISLGTGEGYFAPAAMAAAYHGAPVVNIGEASDAYNTIDKIAAWREYAGDYYHGARSVGHLPQMDHPFDFKQFIQDLLNGEFPHAGFDLKLRWFGAVAKGIQTLIRGYGLDLEGQEAFLFVSPRDTDIRDVACRALVGNESFAGHIPVRTAAFSSAVVCRSILYPAIIYANPGRDVITSQMMNYPDGYTWQGNDGNGYPNYATRSMKEIFFSRGRFYEGHCIWDNLLERYNTGAALSYYSGHGTGGSGISAQYKNVQEQFPLAELKYESLKDFDWWDSWRGYSYYDSTQTKTARWGGDSGYNSQEPSLYDLIHFKWVDQLFDNLHSEIDCWSSCTTGEHLGPIVYLSHGSALWYGAAGSTYGVQDDLHNDWIFHDVLIGGDSFGASESRYQWIFNRDFTTMDPTALYGRSTMFQLTQGGLTNVKVLYGDPTMTCYAPDWIEPTPINP
ncbi:MAG: hypothetical protein QCH96_04595 [Candidatus Thermoplasmatota archaeon]|nr:hypothetical protein [Candidatus Thermoplasmatota archaeon]